MSGFNESLHPRGHDGEFVKKLGQLTKKRDAASERVRLASVANRGKTQSPQEVAARGRLREAEKALSDHQFSRSSPTVSHVAGTKKVRRVSPRPKLTNAQKADNILRHAANAKGARKQKRLKIIAIDVRHHGKVVKR